MDPLEPGARGLLVAVAILIGDLVLSVSVLYALRWIIDRVRLRAWESSWRRFTGPRTENVR